MAALALVALLLPGGACGHAQGPVAPPKAASELSHFALQPKTNVPESSNLRRAGPLACVGSGGCNIDMLKVECLNTPGCAAFSSDGWLKNSTAGATSGRTVDLYARQAGRPTQLHYLRIPGYDALTTGGDLYHVNSNDPHVLEAACSKDTACAGFNSNGYLKSCVADIGSVGVACDLFIKVGGASGPPMPPSLPPTPPPPPPAPPGAGPWAPRIWPLPKSYTNGSSTLVVQPEVAGKLFQLAPGLAPCDALSGAFERYEALSLPHNVPAASGVRPGTLLDGVTVTVTDLSDEACSAHPQLETDESYNLSVPVGSGGKATLQAATIFGAMRGLETFSQLVIFDFDAQQHMLPLAPWHIEDAPRFPHR